MGRDNPFFQRATFHIDALNKLFLKFDVYNEVEPEF